MDRNEGSGNEGLELVERNREVSTMRNTMGMGTYYEVDDEWGNERVYPSS